jgi:hypothetical protein
MGFYEAVTINGLVKSQQTDGTVKSSRCKARASSQAVRRNIEE